MKETFDDRRNTPVVPLFPRGRSDVLSACVLSGMALRTRLSGRCYRDNDDSSLTFLSAVGERAS